MISSAFPSLRRPARILAATVLCLGLVARSQTGNTPSTATVLAPVPTVLAPPVGGVKPAGPITPRIPLEQRQPLIVAAGSDSFPNSYAGSNGQLQGFAVDLLDAIARAMHLKIQRVVLPGKDLFAHFLLGQYDFLQLLGETESRKAYADFTVPYLNLQGAVFVRLRDNPVHTLADLRGRTFAIVGVGSSGEEFLRNHDLACPIIYTSSNLEALRLVESGRADATFGSRLSMFSVIDSEKLTDVVQLPVSIADGDVRLDFAVHKGDALLLARLNEGLAILHRTGEYDRIYHKWYGRYDITVFTRAEVINYVAGILALALLAVTWGWLRQRTLHTNIARQAGLLTEDKQLMQALYDNIPMAMCVVEAAPEGHRLLTINHRAASLLGLPLDTAVGRRLDELPIDPEWTEYLTVALQHWPVDGDILHQECILHASRRLASLTLVPLAPGANGLSRLCILSEDITERRQLNEEIAQTRKLRATGELVGGIAHEFNNLLTPVMFKASEIQLDRAADTRLCSDMDVITQAVQRAAELTRRLLTFGRKTEAYPEEVHLETIVAGTFDLLRPTMDRRIIWENLVPAGLPPLFFNPTDLNQILVNLLLNARDTLEERLAGTPPAGWVPRIRVGAVHLPPETTAPSHRNDRQQPMGWQRISISDTGMGMPPAVVERIFEPFYTTKGVGRGTGLGLATLWHLTTEAGGRVEVESTPGEGTTFHILLPVWPAPKEYLLATEQTD